MDPVTQFDLGNRHLAELRASAAAAALVRDLAKQFANARPHPWRRTIGRMLISTGQRLSGERAAVPCPE
jgi:hypothetical protein